MKNSKYCLEIIRSKKNTNTFNLLKYCNIIKITYLLISAVKKLDHLIFNRKSLN